MSDIRPNLEPHNPMDGLVIIGFDSEWKELGEGLNHILSYQFSGRTTAGVWSGIIYTDGPDQRHRLNFKDLIGKAIIDGRRAGVLPSRWPTEVYASAHFSRADIAGFKDYKDLKVSFDSIRKTYITLNPRLPYRCTFYDDSRNSHDLQIFLRDTMTLSAGGTPLAVLGEAHGLPKLNLPDGMIGNMDILLRDDPDLYERYAIRDAEIAALHLWEMTKFSIENGFGSTPPLTLGSLAVRHLENIWREEGINPHAVLGQEVHSERRWNGRTHRYNTRTRPVPIKSVHENAPLATESFHGGRNEAFVCGFSPLDSWFDFDLSGAYSTAMAGIQMPDWSNLRHELDVKSYTADVLGLARVSFNFPDDTRFPCLPVRSDNGLIFPLTGVSYAGSPEIQLAVEMGADVAIQNGFIVPWLSDIRPIELFSKSVRGHRDALPKKSVFERAWKEIGNSVYGKLAQGLREKRVYDSRTDSSQILPPSRITQPYLAAYTTSLIRAVLGELLHRIPAHRTVLSVTTDGFLTNAPREEIDDTGPLSRLFASLAGRLSDASDFLDLKHFIPTQVLCFKTRGQLGVGIMDKEPEKKLKDSEGNVIYPKDSVRKFVTAKAGHKPPEDVYRRALESLGDADVPDEFKDLAENDWLLKYYLDRDHETKIPVWSFVPMRDMARSDLDMYKIERNQRVSMEYDFKREPTDAEEVFVGRNFGTANAFHLTFQTKPHKDLEAFQETRKLFDQWRTKEQGVLKTLDDWHRWNDYRLAASYRKSGVLTGRGSVVDQAKRMFLKAYTNKLWGLSGVEYQELSDWLTSRGYPTKVSDVKYSKKSKVDAEQLCNLKGEAVDAFKAVLLERFPNFTNVGAHKDQVRQD